MTKAKSYNKEINLFLNTQYSILNTQSLDSTTRHQLRRDSRNNW